MTYLSTFILIFDIWVTPEEGLTTTMVIAQYADCNKVRFPTNDHLIVDREALARVWWIVVFGTTQRTHYNCSQLSII